MRTLLFFLLAACLTACSGDTGNVNSSATDAMTADGEAMPKAQFVKQTIDAPLPALDIPMQSNQVDAATGGRLRFATGTEIDIPAGAFVYEDGRPVTGKVTIDFREFHNAAEIILSGIPMQDWDENTQDWQNFSTAGMFEVRGTDAEQRPVRIAPEHELQIHLASDTGGTYSSWYFDEDKGDWERTGENTAETYSPPAATTATETSAPTARPRAPKAYDPSAIRMDFAGMNLSDFPELRDADKVALQYAGKAGAENDPAENDWIFTTNWYKAELTKTGGAGQYRLYLENDDTEFTTTVEATLLPAAYEAALTEYRQQLAAYDSNVKSGEIRRQQEQQRMAMRRSMPVSRFGVYNYDIYSSWQEPIFANTDFQPAAEQSWGDLKMVYLITDAGKVCVRYPQQNWQRFNFDRKRKNLLVGITMQGDAVVLSPSAFMSQSADLAIRTRRQEWDCFMDSEAVQLKSAASLQELIERQFAS